MQHASAAGVERSGVFVAPRAAHLVPQAEQVRLAVLVEQRPVLDKHADAAHHVPQHRQHACKGGDAAESVSLVAPGASGGWPWSAVASGGQPWRRRRSYDLAGAPPRREMAVPRTYRKPRLTREPSGGSTSPYCASCADASSGYLDGQTQRNR